jgi:hypothetical protein
MACSTPTLRARSLGNKHLRPIRSVESTPIAMASLSGAARQESLDRILCSMSWMPPA